MKLRLLTLALVFVTTVRGHATIQYSGAQNIPIPFDFNGVYLRIDTGVTSAVQPGDWNTAPWMNPFFGGVDIANSDFLRPVITGADQIVKLPGGTTIDGSSNFVAGESGSSTHFGPAANQFQAGSPGYMGFAYRTSAGGPDYYGWLRLQVNNAGAGSILDWAFEDAPTTPIQAGSIGLIPEPGTTLFGLGLCVACVSQRRRIRRRPVPSSSTR